MWIDQFEKWAYEVLQPVEKDTLWHTQMAILFATKNLFKESVERSELALTMDPNNWKASICRARLARPTKGIEILQTEIGNQENDISWIHILTRMEIPGEINLELAVKYWQDQQFEIAIPLFTSCLKQIPQHTDKIHRIMYTYMKNDRSSEIVSLIERTLNG